MSKKSSLKLAEIVLKRQFDYVGNGSRFEYEVHVLEDLESIEIVGVKFAEFYWTEEMNIAAEAAGLHSYCKYSESRKKVIGIIH